MRTWLLELPSFRSILASSDRRFKSPSPKRKPVASSSSLPGVRIVTEIERIAATPLRSNPIWISKGSSTATLSRSGATLSPWTRHSSIQEVLEALGIFDLLSCEYIPHHRDGQVAFHARSMSSEWTTLAHGRRGGRLKILE